MSLRFDQTAEGATRGHAAMHSRRVHSTPPPSAKWPIPPQRAASRARYEAPHNQSVSALLAFMKTLLVDDHPLFREGLAMWIPVGPAGGYVRHLSIDWNDSFGFLWPEGLDPIQRRLGFSYYLDFDLVLRDFATLGIPERPWDRAAVGVTGPSWATSRMRTLTRNDGSLDTRTRPAGADGTPAAYPASVAAAPVLPHGPGARALAGRQRHAPLRHRPCRGRQPRSTSGSGGQFLESGPARAGQTDSPGRSCAVRSPGPGAGDVTTIDRPARSETLRLHLDDSARVVGLERPDVENPEPP